MTTPESRPDGRCPGNARFWAPLIGAVGLVLAFSPTLLSGMRQMQDNPGDTRLLNWIVEHSWRWLRGTPLHESLWDPPFFFPAKGTLAYTENMLGAAPPYWILRLAGVAPDTAFQWWMLITLGLDFAVMYVFLRQALAQSRLAASVGAFLFAFGSARVVQMGHQHLLPQYFSVLALLSLAAALRARDASRRAAGLAGFGVAVALQIWSGIYLGWFLCLALAIACIWALALRSTRASLGVLLFSRWAIVALVVMMIALWPLMGPYLDVTHAVGFRTFEEVQSMLPQPRSWLDLGPTSLSWGWLHRSGFFGDLPMEHEHRIGLGLLTTAAAIAGLWIDRRRPAQLVMALTALTIVAFTIHIPGVESSVWQNLYQFLPAAGAIRGVSRIVMVLLIPAAAGLGAFVDGMLRFHVRPGLIAAFVLLVMFEQAHSLPSYDKRAVRIDVARIARDIDPSCVAFLWNPAAEDRDPYWKWPIDAMWAQMESGVPTMNGFSGQRPPGYPIDQVPLWEGAHELIIGDELDHWVTMNHLDASRICWVRGKSTKGDDGARFVSQTVPTEMHAGEQAEASVRFRNVGRTAWRPQKVQLGTRRPADILRWGPARLELEHAVAPGETVTFTIPLRAPEETGIHSFRWQMVRQGIHWFGTVNPVTQIRVLPRAPGSLEGGDSLLTRSTGGN